MDVVPGLLETVHEPVPVEGALHGMDRPFRKGPRRESREGRSLRMVRSSSLFDVRSMTQTCMDVA